MSDLLSEKSRAALRLVVFRAIASGGAGPKTQELLKAALNELNIPNKRERVYYEVVEKEWTK